MGGHPDSAVGALAGIGVLVTRPVESADRLVQLIETAGGTAIRFPTLAIAPPTDPARLDALLDRLTDVDLALFVSPNAVTQALLALRRRNRSLPSRLPVAAVGAGTAAALRAQGIDALAPPTRFDSEGLLALPALQQVAGKRVLVFRGDGGRELLGDTLRRRGAEVDYAECYRRVRPDADATPLLARWARGEIHVVSVTSATALRNLNEMLPPSGRDYLRRTPVAVLSPAQAGVCRELGLARAPLVAAQATDEALVAAIAAWKR